MQRNWPDTDCKNGRQSLLSLSMTETARREDHLLTHIVRRELEISRDMGGPISKSWWSDDKQCISSKCTTTQQATFTAFHPSNTQRIHQPTHVFIMLLPPMKITFVFFCFFWGFFRWKPVKQTFGSSRGDKHQCHTRCLAAWKSRSHAGDDRGACARVCVTMGPQQQHLRHPAQDTRVPTTLLTPAEASSSGKLRAEHTAVGGNIGSFSSECLPERWQTPIRLEPRKSKSDRSPEMLSNLLFGIWQFYCFCSWWVVLVGNRLLWHVGCTQIFCNAPAIKLLHFYAKKLLSLSRVRHCICLPFKFSWSSAFLHKPTLLLLLGYICISL